MNPKEKAIEIVEKFDYYLFSDKGKFIESSKQCALIHVNGIIEVMLKCDKDNQSYYYMGEQKFWQEVKTEINKL